MVRKFLSLLSPLAICLTVLNTSIIEAQTATKDSGASQVNRGNSWIPSDDFQRAIKDYNIAIVFHPNSATAYYNRGVLLQADGQLESALQITTRRSISSHAMPLPTQIGPASLRSSQVEEAMADCNRAIEIDSRHASAYTNRGGTGCQGRR
jgi:tetratricopeptide (TPR) repeat protein